MVPTWVAVLTGIGGLVVSAVITPFVTLRVAQRGDRTTRRGQDIDRSRSDRDLILKAAELERSDDPRSRRQGSAMLSGLVQMEGLSTDDALLVQSLTRPLTESLLSNARHLIAEGDTVVFELDESDSGEESEGGDDGEDQRH